MWTPVKYYCNRNLVLLGQYGGMLVLCRGLFLTAVIPNISSLGSVIHSMEALIH